MNTKLQNHETVEQFLARGGKINQVKPSAPMTDAQFERLVAEKRALDAYTEMKQKEAENEINRNHAYYGE